MHCLRPQGPGHSTAGSSHAVRMRVVPSATYLQLSVSAVGGAPYGYRMHVGTHTWELPCCPAPACAATDSLCTSCATERLCESKHATKPSRHTSSPPCAASPNGRIPPPHALSSTQHHPPPARPHIPSLMVLNTAFNRTWSRPTFRIPPSFPTPHPPYPAPLPRGPGPWSTSVSIKLVTSSPPAPAPLRLPQHDNHIPQSDGAGVAGVCPRVPAGHTRRGVRRAGGAVQVSAAGTVWM